MNKVNKIKRSKDKTLTEQVYEQLEKKIIFCEIEPGTILTEKKICEMLGAGRTPVREALLLLSKRFLVNISKAGIMIPQMNASLQLQLLEARRPILRTCVECAIMRLTQNDKDSIEDLLSKADNLSDKEVFTWLEKRQEVLGKASKNYFIFESLRNSQGLSRRFFYYYATKENHEAVKNFHKKILEYVLKQDKVNALLNAEKIIDYIENIVRKYTI